MSTARIELSLSGGGGVIPAATVVPVLPMRLAAIAPVLVADSISNCQPVSIVSSINDMNAKLTNANSTAAAPERPARVHLSEEPASAAETLFLGKAAQHLLDGHNGDPPAVEAEDHASASSVPPWGSSVAFIPAARSARIITDGREPPSVSVHNSTP